MSLYMETTKISADRTAAEIQSLLGRVGANQITTHYGKDIWGNREVAGIRFMIFVDGTGDRVFELPVRTKPVFDLLLKRLSPRNRAKKEREVYLQATRVAWRQILRWIEAQIALIDTGMVSTPEVFLPYAIFAVSSSGSMTFYEAIVSGKLPKLLTPGK